MSSTSLEPWQQALLGEIRATVAQSQHFTLAGYTTDPRGLVATLDLDTSEFSPAPGGLPVLPVERLYMVVPAVWPHVPPFFEVDHERWENSPHVLQGTRLCIYLDLDAEWNPTAGMPGVFERLWGWFEDAVAAHFDPANALYQPVGGVLHRTADTPTVVVTEPLDGIGDGFSATGILLRQRTDNRVDVVSWDRSSRTSETLPGILVTLSDSLPRGGGSYLSDLAVAIRGQDSRAERRRLLSLVAKTGRALDPNKHLYLVIAVPNRHLTGESRLHFIGWRLPQPAVESAVRASQVRHQPDNPHPPDEPEVEWTYIDDSRPAVTTRRDIQRPVSWYAGKTIAIWGCGAIGSWLAEHVVRANAGTILLRDTGYVTRGLLARQNYTEHDVGDAKVHALSRRLRSLSDSLTVEPIPGLAQSSMREISDCHIIFDCTVNTSVSVSLERAHSMGRATVPVAQVATDNQTATLGILTVTTGQENVTTNEIDQELRRFAASNPDLQPFTEFWNPDHHAPLTPTLGCSVPTFIGSNADSQAIASTAATLTALAAQRQIAAGYLFSSPYTPYPVPPLTSIPLNHTSHKM